MSQIHTVGLDLSKSVFQVHAVNGDGEVVLKRRLIRKDVVPFFEKLPPCLVGMEVSGGANYLGQRLHAIGHTVRIMPGLYVKPYVKTNKNDANDAEAICEAVRRPNMRFVPVKSPEQQAILLLHRTRELLSRQKVSMTNALKAALAEFGIVVARNSPGTTAALKVIEDPSETRLPAMAREALSLLLNYLKATDSQIQDLRSRIDAIHTKTESCKRLSTIPGVGTLAATALVAMIGDGTGFKSGRDMAAWLGLVPRQHSSGGRQILGRISKRGDPYLRRLLVIGAMALMRGGERSKYRMIHWATGLAARKCYRVAAVALANKLARIAWAVLVSGQPYKECPQ